jgi:hypothetical protein
VLSAVVVPGKFGRPEKSFLHFGRDSRHDAGAKFRLLLQRERDGMEKGITISNRQDASGAHDRVEFAIAQRERTRR